MTAMYPASTALFLVLAFFAITASASLMSAGARLRGPDGALVHGAGALGYALAVLWTLTGIFGVPG